MRRTIGCCVVALLVVPWLPPPRHLLAAPDDPAAAAELLVAEASSAPAEFAADLLIRIATAGDLEEPLRRRELLETAFMRAYGAQEPLQRGAPAVPFDSEAGARVRAYATGLDAFTLQLRAVSGMVNVDPARARELFEWIDFYLPAGSCGASLVPVADEYYATLTAIARRTFAATAQGRDDALRFFELYLWRTHLPSEIPALLRAVKAMRLARVEAGYFEVMLHALIDHLDADARGFSIYGLDIVSKMTELADGDRKAGVFGETLMRGLRTIIVTQSRSRCLDSVAETSIADMFNTIVRRHDFPPDQVAPLSWPDIKPVTILGAAPADRYWQTAESRRLLQAFLALRDAAGSRRGNTARRRNDAVVRSIEWQAAAQEYLRDLEIWNGALEPIEREYFDEKCLLYDVYTDLVPPGAMRARAIASAIEFLRRSDTGRLPRAAWFANVNRVMERADPGVLTALDQSGSPLMSLYARTERLLQTSRRR